MLFLYFETETFWNFRKGASRFPLQSFAPEKIGAKGFSLQSGLVGKVSDFLETLTKLRIKNFGCIFEYSTRTNLDF